MRGKRQSLILGEEWLKNVKGAKKKNFYPTCQDILISFAKLCTFFKNKYVIQDEGVIKYVHKTDAEKGGGLGKC